MEKKIIFLEVPIEMLVKIEKQNMVGSRSAFVSDLLEKQLQTHVTSMHATPEIPSCMTAGELKETPGEIGLFSSRGLPLGKFNINTVEGFDTLAKKISEMSSDPMVRMKARRWR
jgi:hypothetical protein